VSTSDVESKSMKEMLSLLFKGKALSFPDHKDDTGFNMAKPPPQVPCSAFLTIN
jgi:hypothetical protein